jgi:hypothetical protein
MGVASLKFDNDRAPYLHRPSHRSGHSSKPSHRAFYSPGLAVLFGLFLCSGVEKTHNPAPSVIVWGGRARTIGAVNRIGHSFMASPDPMDSVRHAHASCIDFFSVDLRLCFSRQQSDHIVVQHIHVLFVSLFAYFSPMPNPPLQRDGRKAARP